MTTIPRSLAFVKSSLYDGEGEKWLDWYGTLHTPDKINVGRFLRHSYTWMSDEAEQLRARYQSEAKQTGREPDGEFLKGDYFIVSAIGSTARGEQTYNDVDLLIVTNRIWRDMGSFERDLLAQMTAQGFHYTIDPTVSEAYRSPWGRPDRTLVTLTPKQGTGKGLHDTVQPEIPNERYWQERDGDSKVVLYRFGDTTGYFDAVEVFLNGLRLLRKFEEVERYQGLMRLDDDQLRLQNSNERIDWESYKLPKRVIKKMKKRGLTESEYVEALFPTFS